MYLINVSSSFNDYIESKTLNSATDDFNNSYEQLTPNNTHSSSIAITPKRKRVFPKKFDNFYTGTDYLTKVSTLFQYELRGRCSVSDNNTFQFDRIFIST
ncbi:hypothetical protein A3Q56_04238 [Intoshia linei]|uniref:Uncharacterized protein n=1 Tax=Intoshia linei TaxID=1819745 RepID=A0A177B1N7_9BILA|nr:hypothetical protein A3Q56_04238 [Intoshia linei]